MLSFVDEETLMKVAEVLGSEDAVKVMDTLKDTGEITDDEIANKTGT